MYSGTAFTITYTMILSAVQEIYHDKFSYTTKPKAEWYTKTGVVYFLYNTKHHCMRNLSHTQLPQPPPPHFAIFKQ